MKTKLICLSVIIILGIVGISIYSNNISNERKISVNNVITQNQEFKFRYLNGDFMGDHATYTFQTPPEEKNYADDCIGCEEEVGNAVIFAEFGCQTKTKYLFESNSKRDVIEKGNKLDENGFLVGEKRLSVFKDKENKITSARIFWTEGDDFWAVQAPSIEAAKALEESEEYYSMRRKVAEERKTYVPIQNANTQRLKVLKDKECNEK